MGTRHDTDIMFLRRAAPALTKRTATVARRGFAGSVRRFDNPREGNPKPGEQDKLLTTLSEIKDEHDLLPPGGAPGTVPTDLEQATGPERLEILGKMQGVDVFDMRPLDASRVGTLDDIHHSSDGAHNFEGEPKTMADFVRPEYR